MKILDYFRKLQWLTASHRHKNLYNSVRDKIGRAFSSFAFITAHTQQYCDRLRNLFKNYPSKNSIHTKILKSRLRGYVAILLTVFVPLILYGTKLVLDEMTLHNMKIQHTAPTERNRKCAAEAALWVAKNYNPGVTLHRQKWALYKVADQVYNNSLAYGNTLLTNAIPGIDINKKSEVSGKGLFNPLVIKTTPEGYTRPKVEYSSAPKYLTGFKIYDSSTGNVIWNLPFAAWKVVDKLTDLNIDTYDKFDELNSTELSKGNYILDHVDRCQYPHQWWIRKVDGYPTRYIFLPGKSYSYDIICSFFSTQQKNVDESGYTEDFVTSNITSQFTYAWQYWQRHGNYTCRTNADDPRVKIEIAADEENGGKIKVTTDNDVGYAIPAECNVDIVLACPTNGAATNMNNYDANSVTANASDSTEPYSTSGRFNTTDDGAFSTPIYQIGQGFRHFLKEFYHTRGVTVGLIPYSGKVSFDANRDGLSRACWWTSNWAESDYVEKQNTTLAYLRSNALYQTYGGPAKNLGAGYNQGTLLTGYPIMCRCGVSVTNAGRPLRRGDLLSTAFVNRESTAAVHFWLLNSNPCYGGYANLLSMRCERTCTTYLPNPYYIIEPTADVQKVYEMCGALYPFYDPHNVSNFLFIPISWANNLWQDWTKDPTCDAITGDDGQLARPSKLEPVEIITQENPDDPDNPIVTEKKRKKVLIFVVNKPDWFEPQELTYIGFDNDYSEIPMVESDCIRGDINYGDTTLKFADGSAYDGTVAGPKKVLKLTGFTRNETSGYYECGDTLTACTLTFPKKYLVKVVVEPICAKVKSLSPPKDIKTLSYYNGQYIAVTTGPHCRIYTSTDGTTWKQGVDLAGASSGTADAYVLGYNNGKYIHCTRSSGYIRISDNLTSWEVVGKNGVVDDVISGTEYNDRYIICKVSTGELAYTTDGGHTWSPMGTISELSAKGSIESITSNNGILVANTTAGWVSRSTDGGETWSTPVQALASLYSVGIRQCRSGNGKFVALECSPTKISESVDGITWSTPQAETIGASCRCLSYGPAGWVYITYGGDVYLKSGKITFNDITETDNQCTIPSREYAVTERKEFYIEPQQINGGSDGAYTITFNAKNIRLISAEITNRPYKKILRELIPYVTGSNELTFQSKFKQKISFDATIGKGNVVFSNIGNTSLQNMTRTHTADDGSTQTSSASLNFNEIDRPTTFYIPAASFNGNYANEKIFCRFNNAHISAVTLKNQQLRAEAWRAWDGPTYADSGVTYWRGHNAGTRYCSSRCGSSVSYINLGGTTYGIAYYYKKRNIPNATLRFDIYANDVTYLKYQYSVNGQRTSVAESKTGCQSYVIENASNNIPQDSRGEFLYVYIPKDEAINSSNFATLVKEITLTNNDDCVMNTSNPTDTSTGVYLNATGDTVCFDGKGDVYVTVGLGSSSEGGTVKYLTQTNNEITETITRAMVSKRITLDPGGCKFEEHIDSNGNPYYTTRVTVTDCAISNIQYDTTPVVEFTKLRLPEMSRVVDYSTNPYTNHDYGVTSAFSTYWEYDALKGYYTNKDSRGYNLGGVCDYPGDCFSVADMLLGNIKLMQKISVSEWYQTDKTARWQYEFPAGSLVRPYIDFSSYGYRFDQDGHPAYYNRMFNDYTSLPAKSMSLMMTGLTMPINAVLYYGAAGDTPHAYQWQSDANGNIIEYDPSEACKKVTKDALKKLKTDWGDNLRVYVILYRKQSKYKHKVRGDEVNSDYTYLAPSTINSYAGFSSDMYKIYDITALEGDGGLKDTLNKIATEIKQWANYTEARNL